MRTTIKDIAKATGLSITTVSLVLNNKPHKIAKKTRELIQKTAKELNYIPNQLARGLVSSKSKTIGLIVPDITNAYFAEFAKNIQNEAKKYGYSMMVCDSDNKIERECEYIRLLYQNGITTLIMASVAEDDGCKQSIKLLQDLHIQTVFLDRSNEHFDEDCVILNHFYGSYIATKYLLAMGHKKIGCITGPVEIQSSNERLRGFKQALYEAGIENSLTYIGDYQLLGGVCGAEQLLKKGVTAIYAFNDMMAYGVYKVASKYKLSIPRDLSVIGFDDIPFSELLQVPLTTVSQPIEAMAKQAVQRLIEKVEDCEKDRIKQYFVFKPELVERESVKDLG